MQYKQALDSFYEVIFWNVFPKYKAVYYSIKDLVSIITENYALALFENKNALTIDAPALTGIGDVQLFYIKHLSADALTLQMAEGADTSEMELKKLK